MGKPNRYIPALRFTWLTPLYDPLLKRGDAQHGFKSYLIQQAGIRPHMQVLDLGCGTGTLSVMIKRAHPGAMVTGMDGDPKVLEIAREKTENAVLLISFDYGLAGKLPYPDQSFQRVLTSLVIHHLDTRQKLVAFQEIYRVLQPGGELHLIDFGKPCSLYGRILAHAMVFMEETRDNLLGYLGEMIRSAGFSALEETKHFTTIFGDLTAIKSIK